MRNQILPYFVQIPDEMRRKDNVGLLLSNHRFTDPVDVSHQAVGQTLHFPPIQPEIAHAKIEFLNWLREFGKRENKSLTLYLGQDLAGL